MNDPLPTTRERDRDANLLAWTLSAFGAVLLLVAGAVFYFFSK